MSEKLFLIITGVLETVAALGPTFFGLDFVVAFIAGIIPLAVLPLMLINKKVKA